MSLALPREDLAAGILAAAVHVFFVLLLVFGVSWQIQEPQPIMAEIWQALPDPLTVPAPVPEPSPPLPEPKPEPAPEPKAADIALEKKKQAELLKKQKLEEARAKEQENRELKKKQQQDLKAQALLEKRQQEEDKRRREEAKRVELELEQEAAQQEADEQKRALQKKQADAKRREALRQEEEDLQRQMMEESLAAEANQAKLRAAAVQRVGEIQKIVELYKAKISDKVRSNTRLPENLAGNPEAEFEVNVLPTGEITKVKLLKSSGNAAYDKEVQRGIEKSSPLPIPADRDAAAQFKLLTLKHKAKE